MRPRDVATAVEDAVRAGDSILAFLGNATLEGYESDRLLASAVERQFEILGEALSRALRTDASLSVRIPEVHKVIGFRNILAHGYDVTDDETVFNNAKSELPALLGKLHGLIGEDVER